MCTKLKSRWCQKENRMCTPNSLAEPLSRVVFLLWYEWEELSASRNRTVNILRLKTYRLSNAPEAVVLLDCACLTHLSAPHLLHPLLSHIPSILPGPWWKGQECFHSAFSCRVAYYLLLLGTSNTQACKGANSLYQSPHHHPPSSHPFTSSLRSALSPECLARRHAVSQHPGLNEKGHLNSLEAEGSEDPVGLPATFLPFQDRTGEMEQREQPFIKGFFFMEQFSPLLPLVPVDIAFC